MISVNYLLKKCGGSIDLIKLITMVYIADRYHLRKYGRPVTESNYYAMPKGPVNSLVYDLCKESDFLEDFQKEYFASFIKIDKYRLKSKKNIDDSYLSGTNKEALKYAWALVKDLEKKKINLIDFTHIFPEWKKHEDKLKDKGLSSIEMDYKDFFDDAAESDIDKISLERDPFKVIKKEELAYAKDRFIEDQGLSLILDG